MGLGAIDGPETVSLAEARAAAELARKQVKAGIDPIEARAAERAGKRLEQATRLTFQECAAAVPGGPWIQLA